MKQRIKRTQFLKTISCPICGRFGYLKLRRGKYYEVDHYSERVTLKNMYWRRSGFKGTYISCCYIGLYHP